jgi:D-alanine-D-alanine ligase-like ATP-grasp enzyme
LRDGGFFYDAFDADDDVEKDALTQSRASSLRAFASRVKKENAVVFLSVHGGVGEDGTLQAFFETNGVAFTGSGAAASRLCMDKSATGAALAAARLEGVTTCRKVTVTAWEMSEALASASAAAGGASASDDIRRQGRDPVGAWWARLVASVGGDARDGLCIKPNSDGCSTGVARLRSSADLWQYATAVTRGAATAAVGDQRVAMPSPPPFAFVLEPFVVASAVEVFFDERAGTENVRFKQDNADARLATNEEAVITDGQPLPERDPEREPERDSLTTAPRRLIEITAGVYGAFGAARCLPPSATVAERACAVLSLEEKFQGGTGVNLTPVPPELIEASVLETIKRRIASAANALGVEGFARIDAFADARTGDVVVIEANTVPGMTPSTVLFHQALAETPSVEPAAFLARAVEHAVRRRDDAMPGTGDGAEERFRRASARVEREER